MRSNIWGMIAVFIALGGVAGAADSKKPVTSKQIKDGGVKTADLAKDAVNSKKVKDGQIKAADLAKDAIASQKIKNGEVKAEDLAPDSVGTEHVIDGSLRPQDIQGGAAGLIDGAPAGGDLTGTYPNPKVGPNAVELGWETTGDYVKHVGAGTGLVSSGATGEEAVRTLSFNFALNEGLGGGEAAFGPNRLLFEGAMADTAEVSLMGGNPTTDRTLTLPNESGNLLSSATPAGGDLSGTHGDLQLKPNSVGSSEIADNSVGSADIANGTVDMYDLAPPANYVPFIFNAGWGAPTNENAITWGVSACYIDTAHRVTLAGASRAIGGKPVPTVIGTLPAQCIPGGNVAFLAPVSNSSGETVALVGVRILTSGEVSLTYFHSLFEDLTFVPNGFHINFDGISYRHAGF